MADDEFCASARRWPTASPGRSLERTGADAAEDDGAGRAGFLSGRGVLGSEPGRSGQPPAGGIHRAGRCAEVRRTAGTTRGALARRTREAGGHPVCPGLAQGDADTVFTRRLSAHRSNGSACGKRRRLRPLAGRGACGRCVRSSACLCCRTGASDRIPAAAWREHDAAAARRDRRPRAARQGRRRRSPASRAAGPRRAICSPSFPSRCWRQRFSLTPSPAAPSRSAAAAAALGTSTSISSVEIGSPRSSLICTRSRSIVTCLAITAMISSCSTASRSDLPTKARSCASSTCSRSRATGAELRRRNRLIRFMQRPSGRTAVP